MHVVIERASKHVNVYTPMQWYTLASSAKKNGSPYRVTEMAGHMKDFKILSELYCKRLREAVSMKSPEWHKMKALMVQKQSPHVLFVKYAHDETDFIPLINTVHHEQSAETAASLPVLENESSVSKAKKDDLQYMCSQLIIPKEYHCFYSSLPLERQHNVPEPFTAPAQDGLSTSAECVRYCTRSVSLETHAQPQSRKRRWSIGDKVKASLTGNRTSVHGSSSSQKAKPSGTSASKRKRL